MIKHEELQKLQPDAMIELFVIDATSAGGEVFRFHAGTNKLSQNIRWQGNEYIRFPVEATGFEITSSGSAPRPKLVVSNIMSGITALLLEYDDLMGAKVIRKRTLAKYLDAENFPDGNLLADPTSYFSDEVYFVDRKVNETRSHVEFELVSSLDLVGVMLPKRQIIQNSCAWRYRSAECGYTGTKYFTRTDKATSDQTQDVCGKRLKSCELRFGDGTELPFGGFPGADLYGGNG